MKNLFILLLLVCVFTSCKEEDEPKPDEFIEGFIVCGRCSGTSESDRYGEGVVATSEYNLKNEIQSLVVQGMNQSTFKINLKADDDNPIIFTFYINDELTERIEGDTIAFEYHF